MKSCPSPTDSAHSQAESVYGDYLLTRWSKSSMVVELGRDLVTVM